MELICAIISTIGMIIVAVIGAKSSKAQKEQAEFNARCDERAKIRAEESRLSMAMMHSTMQLSVASANALLNRVNNGNVEEAYKNAKKAEKDYEEFLIKVASKEVGK